MSLWVSPGTQQVFQILRHCSQNPQLLEGTRGAPGPRPPSHSCLTGQERPTSGAGLRGTGTKAPRALASGHLGAEGLAQALDPGMLSGTLLGSLPGQ